MSWRYVDAAVAGRSHREIDTPCQDRCVCAVVTSADGGDVLISVVSDGAGSAAFAADGARVVCETFVDVVAAAVHATSDLDALPDVVVRSWFLRAREQLRALARAAGVDIREYAATALLAVAGDHQTLCARIGDGAIVVRRSPHEAFEVALWPDGGEYTNQTYFITDDAAAERTAIARFDDVFDVVAFSDGLQHLALEQSTRRAFPPFFTPLVGAVRDAAGGIDRLRGELLAYLNSAAIDERTADDKSLVIGCRMAPG